jgi:hypothetical protein
MAWQAVLAGGGVAFLIGSLTIGAGCHQPDTATPVAPLRPNASPFERDIPIPEGFALVENASEDHATGTRRLYLRHLYAGTAPKAAVRKFYRDHMHRAHWSLLWDGNVKGIYTLRYEKGNEACVVRITDGIGRPRESTHIQVIIAQEERGKSPPVAQNRQ